MPLIFWATHVLQWLEQWVAFFKNVLIFKFNLSSDARLKLAGLKQESLVIANQICGGEYVLGPCPHRPSHWGSWLCLTPSFYTLV
jgi:hypothetical protein